MSITTSLQSLSIALNAILSDTVSNSRRNIFGGSCGWQANAGINVGQYQFTSTPINVGSCSIGMLLTSDYPVDITFTNAAGQCTFLAQTIFMASGMLTSITINLSAGYSANSITNVALVS